MMFDCTYLQIPFASESRAPADARNGLSPDRNTDSGFMNV